MDIRLNINSITGFMEAPRYRNYTLKIIEGKIYWTAKFSCIEGWEINPNYSILKKSYVLRVQYFNTNLIKPTPAIPFEDWHLDENSWDI